MSDDQLKTEMETYEKNKPTLLGSSEGEFVLIKGEEVVGTYSNKMDAIKVGYEKFGNVPFLVRKVTEIEESANFVSNLIDI